MFGLPNRKSNRLHGFDYSSNNYYHVTICTAGKNKIFGMGEDLTQFGTIAENQLLKINERYSDITVDKYVIMPNHIHAVIIIGGEKINASETLSTVIGLYKSGVSKLIHQINPLVKVWQGSFYDHVIRNGQDYENVCVYIDENPKKWLLGDDEYY